jgi:hypothetical protein
MLDEMLDRRWARWLPIGSVLSTRVGDEAPNFDRKRVVGEAVHAHLFRPSSTDCITTSQQASQWQSAAKEASCEIATVSRDGPRAATITASLGNTSTEVEGCHVHKAHPLMNQ